MRVYSLVTHQPIVEPKVVEIPAGTFLMGSEDGRRDERPVHRVWVDGFFLATLPVTNREYALFVDTAGHRRPDTWDEKRFSHPRQPVVAVSWFDATAYCEWLSRMSGKVYRLPTEAEREKSARGGVASMPFPWGNDSPDWMSGGVHGHPSGQPDLAGQDPPNGYGLHNMGDLVHEWCKDWYATDYYQRSPERNPQGPSDGVRRASRGGGWRHSIKVTRSAARSSIPPDRTFNDYGFRLAMSSES